MFDAYPQLSQNENYDTSINKYSPGIYAFDFYIM